jgi:hypothetical protein
MRACRLEAFLVASGTTARTASIHSSLINDLCDTITGRSNNFAGVSDVSRKVVESGEVEVSIPGDPRNVSVLEPIVNDQAQISVAPASSYTFSSFRT